MAGIARLFWRAWIDHPADPSTSFAGKTVIITGANTGVGFESAVKFAQLEASKIIFGVRNIEKGNAAKTALESQSGRQGVAEVWQVDMSSYDGIHSFASRASKELSSLHVVLLNAGIMKFQFKKSTYGWEDTIQVNTLSTTLLGLLLLPKLRESSTSEDPSYLTFVGSGTYRFATITAEHRSAESILESYNEPNTLRPQQYYALSKLFLMCTMRTMAEKEGSDPAVIIAAVCPGMVKTGLGRDFTTTPMKKLLGEIFGLLQRTPEVGSRSLVSVTTLGKKIHGQLWQHDEIQA